MVDQKVIELDGATVCEFDAHAVSIKIRTRMGAAMAHLYLREKGLLKNYLLVRQGKADKVNLELNWSPTNFKVQIADGSRVTVTQLIKALINCS